jgi:hypothetical protein
VSSVGSDVRASLRKDVREARAQSTELRKELRARDRFERELNPLLVEGRLTGARIGIVGIGGLPNGIIQDVRASLTDTGARLESTAVIRSPLDLGALPPGAVVQALRPGASGARRARLLHSVGRITPEESGDLRKLGVAFGSELATGGPTLQRLRRTLLQSSSGALGGLDAVVLVRLPEDLKGNDAKAFRPFEDGIAAGLLGTAGTPVVGVEDTSTDPSQIRWYRDRRLTSVDNVDAREGRAALVFALAGASGTFGVKSTAEALLPRAASAR